MQTGTICPCLFVSISGILALYSISPQQWRKHYEKIPFDIFQIVVGDITTIDADAIINPTDSSYSGAGGIDLAIHSAAGKDLIQALSSNMRIEAGQAIITPSFQIKTAKWIIHTVGPKWKTGFFFEEFKLAECYRRSLQLAIDHDCKSVAFPCISIGANQFPKERAAEIAICTVANMLQAIDHVSCLKRVFFVCGSKIQSEIYKRQLKKAIIEYFIHNNSPESYESFFSIGEYYSYVEQLAVLEWGKCHITKSISATSALLKTTGVSLRIPNMTSMRRIWIVGIIILVWPASLHFFVPGGYSMIPT